MEHVHRPLILVHDVCLESGVGDALREARPEAALERGLDELDRTLERERSAGRLPAAAAERLEVDRPGRDVAHRREEGRCGAGDLDAVDAVDEELRDSAGRRHDRNGARGCGFDRRDAERLARPGGEEEGVGAPVCGEHLGVRCRSVELDHTSQARLRRPRAPAGHIAVAVEVDAEVARLLRERRGRLQYQPDALVLAE
ncbi:hypothetical protein C5D18_00110 [Rathayibacter tritici]|nr:hypothetical protein C5D18_00110 [Rathayibacter tritici]